MSSDSEDSLGDQIVENFVKSQFPVDGTKEDFLPHGLLNTLITRSSVASTLGIRDVQVTLLSGMSGAKNRHKAMTMFFEHKFNDACLPITEGEIKDSDRPYFTKPWNALRRDRFKKDQWRFLAPVFPIATTRLDLDQDCIFPFIFVDENRREGTFGNVYQVTIHPAHQEQPMLKANGEPANAAIKELKAVNDKGEKNDQVYKEWFAEAKALEETSDLSHPHMIQVKAIITKGRRNYFMFQWADGGSLRDFYEQNRRPSLDPGFVREIVEQLAGLADAVDVLHNFGEQGSYRHGDLKPENILRFEDSTKVGILKIADMGLAKHHPMPTALRGGTSSRFGTPSYEPPEVVMLSQAARSRLYDVWSMGCITLEVIVWLLYGYDAVLNFNNSLKSFSGNPSPYWEIELQGEARVAKVHSRVTACMDHIARDEECGGSTALADLLRLVRAKLLVVPLPTDRSTFRPGPEFTTSGAGNPSPNIPTFQFSEPNLLVPEPSPEEFRATARILRVSLEKMLDKGRDNNTYWYSGKSRHKLDEAFNNLFRAKGLMPGPQPVISGGVSQRQANFGGLQLPARNMNVRNSSHKGL